MKIPQWSASKVDIGVRIGRGAFRECYSLHNYPNYVIKKPRPTSVRAVVHNRTEAHIWYNYPEIRRYLCPVIALIPSLNWSVVMARTNPLPKEMFVPPGYNSIISFLGRVLPDIVLDLDSPLNWGFLSGRYVVIDYGSCFSAEQELNNGGITYEV